MFSRQHSYTTLLAFGTHKSRGGYNFRRDSLIVLVLFLSVSEQLLQVLFALLRAGFSGSANSTVLLKNHGNQILCEI